MKIEVRREYEGRAKAFFSHHEVPNDNITVKASRPTFTDKGVPFLEITTTVEGCAHPYTELFSLDYFTKDTE